MSDETERAPAPEPRLKASHIGAPAIFALELECKHLSAAFGGYGCYVVGSSLTRPDWRDVDVRLIMGEEEFGALFPAAPLHSGAWEFDDRWLVLTVAISERLSRITGLKVDFQFQPQTHANKMHKGERNAIGLRLLPS